MEENTNLEVQEMPASPAEESFDDLIRGKYKPEFDARVQKIIEGRLKSLHRESSEGQLRLALQYREMVRSRAAMEEMLRRAVTAAADRKQYQLLLDYFSDKAKAEAKGEATSATTPAAATLGSTLSSTGAESLMKAMTNYLKKGNTARQAALSAL